MNKDILLKVGLTLLLFIILFTKINPLEIIEVFSSLNHYYFVVAVFFVPLLYLIRTYKWNILLKAIRIEKPYTEIFKILLIGVFYGLITPGKVGEFGRAYHINEKKSLIIPTILIEKISDILILILLAFVTIVLLYNNYDLFYYIILAISLALFLVIGLSVNRKSAFLLNNIFKISKNNVVLYIDTIQSIAKNRKLVAEIFILTFIYYLIAYVLAFFLLVSLNVNPVAVVTMPIIVLMGNIPITISGFGLRESIATISFIQLGESGIYGFSFSVLLFFTIVLLPGVIGYLFTITEDKI